MDTHQNNSIPLAVLAYIGPLIIVSYFLGQKDSFVKFHIKQGLLLFIIEIALWFFSMFLWILFPILFVVNIGLLVWTILGIVNAAQRKEKELPLIGRWAKNFTF